MQLLYVLRGVSHKKSGLKTFFVDFSGQTISIKGHFQLLSLHDNRKLFVYNKKVSPDFSSEIKTGNFNEP